MLWRLPSMQGETTENDVGGEGLVIVHQNKVESLLCSGMRLISSMLDSF
jgi:hypothetical protein